MKAAGLFFSALFFVLTTGSALSQVFGEVGEKLSSLPDTIPIESGKLSLHADYANPEQLPNFYSARFGETEKQEETRFVPIYLINDTDEKLPIPNQDGDIYLKQEAWKEGEWMRSHPHAYSWCGNSYTRIELPPHHYLKVLRPLDSNEDAPLSKVRYRIYDSTETLRALISNEGEARVSPKLIEKARFDTMGIRIAPLPLLLELVSGDRKVEATDHMLPRWNALHALHRFPGDEQALQAVENLFSKPILGLENPEQVDLIREDAFRVYQGIADSEQVFDLALSMIDEKESLQYPAFRSLAAAPPELAGRANEHFETIFQNPKNPLFSQAMRTWSFGTLAEKEVRGERLKKWENDSTLSPKQRNEALELYRRLFPNAHYNRRFNIDHKTRLFTIQITNISSKPISVSTSNLHEWIEFEFSDIDGNPLPESTRKPKPSSFPEETITIAPGETGEVSGINPWPLVTWPVWFPVEARLRVIVQIPGLGEVGSGYGSTSYLQYDNAQEWDAIASLLDQPLRIATP